MIDPNEFVEQSITLAKQLRERSRLQDSDPLQVRTPEGFDYDTLTEEHLARLSEHYLLLSPYRPPAPIPVLISEPTEPTWGLYCDEEEVKQFVWLQDAFREGNRHITLDCPQGARPWAHRLSIQWKEGFTFRLSEVQVPGAHYRAQIEDRLLGHEVRHL